MPNLFATLGAAAQALRTFDRAMTVTQNNVQNALTPGFVKQRQSFDALTFDAANGLIGGVRAGAVEDSRNRFAEVQVQQQAGRYGYAHARVAPLAAIDGIFSLQSADGIAAAIRDLSAAFSGWSVNPNSAISREQVLAQAQAFAEAVQRGYTAARIEAGRVEAQIQAGVAQVNDLILRVQDYNASVYRTGKSDPASEAALYESVEQLNGVIPVSMLRQSDGSVMLLTSGQSPLVVGEDTFPLHVDRTPADAEGGLDTIRIYTIHNADITDAIDGGAIGGLLDVRNRVIPGLIGGGSEIGSLNTFAKAFADRVNAALASGQTAAGAPGPALFTYDAARPAQVAGTIALTGIGAGDLAAIAPGPPAISNGVALSLANLANSTDPADQVNGQSLQEFFSAIAAGAGRESARASAASDAQAALLAQSRQLRAEISGVSLDEEAIQMLALQRSYEAAARMVTVVDEMTQTILNMVR